MFYITSQDEIVIRGRSSQHDMSRLSTSYVLYCTMSCVTIEPQVWKLMWTLYCNCILICTWRPKAIVSIYNSPEVFYSRLIFIKQKFCLYNISVVFRIMFQRTFIHLQLCEGFSQIYDATLSGTWLLANSNFIKCKDQHLLCNIWYLSLLIKKYSVSLCNFWQMSCFVCFKIQNFLWLCAVLGFCKSFACTFSEATQTQCIVM